MAGQHHHQEIQSIDTERVVRAKVDTDQGHDHRHARRAGDQHREYGGDEPVAPGTQDARRHHRRNAAPISEEHGQGGRAVQPQAVHEHVHEVAYSREVSKVFEHGEAHQEGQQVRQNYGNGAGRPQQRPFRCRQQQAVRIHVPGHRRDEGVKHAQDAVLGELACREDQLKDPQENQHQHGISPDRMHHQTVDLFAPVPARMRDAGHTLEQV